MTQHNDMTTMKKIEARKRRDEAFIFYAMGWTQQAIADHQGVSKATVCKGIARSIREAPVRPASEVSLIQVLAANVMRGYLEPKIMQGNTSAVLAALKCMEHEAKLLNLINTTQININNTNDFRTTATRYLEQIAHNQTLINQPALPQNQNPSHQPQKTSADGVEVWGDVSGV